MAFPSLQGTRAKTLISTNETTHTVNLPAGISAGELLIVSFNYGVTANTITFPAGWTAIPNGTAEETGGSSAGIATAYRQADGSEGATINIGTSVTCRSLTIISRYSGHINPATQAPQAAATNAVNGNANPPTLTPTGGAKDYLWIACGSNSHTDVYSAAPSNYGNFTSDVVNTGNNASSVVAGVADRQLNAASEDPGAFTGANAAAEWAAVTIAIHPAAGGGSGTDLTVSDAAHAHASDGFALIAESFLAATDAGHIHVSDAIALAADCFVAVQDAQHSHASDAIALTAQNVLSIGGATHEHATDAITITPINYLVVTDAVHTHAVDAIALSTDSYLVIADARHVHVSDSIVLGGIETTAHYVYAIASENRVYAVPAHVQEFGIAAENRTYAIPVAEIETLEDRTYAIAIENRTMSISHD